MGRLAFAASLKRARERLARAAHDVLDTVRTPVATLRCEVWKAKDGWRWRLVTTNNFKRIVAESGEAYTRQYDAWRAWRATERALLEDAPLPNVTVDDD